MCGLCGWIDYASDQRDNLATIEKMAEKLNKRGPDTSGEYVYKHAALMHKRLIIIDPEHGAQPMYLEYKGENYVIVYNGELYNTANIKSELIRAGHTFTGHGDTEALLHAYAEWGAGCLARLNGIYAFAIWAEHAETLFMARDRMGVKPLFYYVYRNGIIFGSEIKAILANPIVPSVIDREGIAEMLLIGPGKINGSAIFKDIHEVKQAEYIIYSRAGIKKGAYWELKAAPHPDDLAETVLHTRELVSDAIVRQLISDVPLACFLSGGLDSSIISKVAADYYKAHGLALDTYSVDYEANSEYFIKNSFQPDMDNPFIKLMTAHIGSEHRDVVLNNADLALALREAADAREMPGMADIDSSLLLFCREVRKRNKVCISGECADEIFGGYPWYHREDMLNRHTFPWSQSADLRIKLTRPEILPDDPEEFINKEYRKTIAAADYLESDSPKDRRIREMFALNLYWFMQTLLIRSDRMSSYNGLEVRVPYCDHRIVEYLYNMPWDYRSLYGREKGVLREAFKELLPYEVVNRKKSPYPKTFNPIFFDCVKSETDKIITDLNSPVNELLDTAFVRQLLDGRYMMAEPWYGQLMRLPQVYGFIIQLNHFLIDYNVQLTGI